MPIKNRLLYLLYIYISVYSVVKSKGQFHENVRKRSASESDLGDDPTDAAVALVFFANFFLQTKQLFARVKTNVAQNIFVFFDNAYAMVLPQNEASLNINVT